MPAFTRFEKASSFFGFSLNFAMRPFESRPTTPYCVGSETSVRAIVTAAPFRLWKSYSALKSTSQRMSPIETTKVSSKKFPTRRTAPAVPAGFSSKLYRIDAL